MHLSIVSPTLTPGAHGVSGGDLSNQTCTILHIWGIAFLANPLQYPCFAHQTPWGQVDNFSVDYKNFVHGILLVIAILSDHSNNILFMLCPVRKV